MLRVEAPTLATRILPGQFVMAKLAGVGWDPFLREPLLLAGQSPTTAALDFWVPGGSPTRDRLRDLPLHATLDLLGPMGSGIALRREWRHLLLVAEGLALGALLAVMQAALGAGQAVTLLNLSPDGTAPFPAEALPASIEYHLAGDVGLQADVTTHRLLQWADGVIAAGSLPFYRQLLDALRAARPGQRRGFAHGFLLEPFGWQPAPPRWGAATLACALGACRACLVELRRDKVLACTRGPLADLWEV